MSTNNSNLKEEQNIKRKNNKLLIIISCIIVTLIMLGVVGFIISVNIRSTNQEKAIQEQLDLGNKYLNELDYEQAIVAYESAIEIDPMSVDAYLGLADTYMSMEDFEKAKEVLQTGYDATGDERLKDKITELEEIIAIGIFFIDKDNDGKHDNDVKILTRIINEQKDLGAIVDEDLNSEQYVWVDGRLIEIEWGNMKLSGAISFAGLGSLRIIDCRQNQLKEIDISQNLILEYLFCMDNCLTKLDVTNNPKLFFLECGNNYLTDLDVTQNLELAYLTCGNNQLTTLDVSNNYILGSFHCGWNQLTSLDVSQNLHLYDFGCSYNQLNSIDVSNNNKLFHFFCEGNNLNELDISNNPELEYLSCQETNITTLNCSNNSILHELHIDSNVEIINMAYPNGVHIEE